MAEKENSLDLLGVMDEKTRATLSMMITDSGLNREEVAERLGGLVGQAVTKDTINAYTAITRLNYKFPFCWAAPFELVTGSMALTELHAQARGVPVLSDITALNDELGRINSLLNLLQNQKRVILAMVGGDHGLV